MFIARNDMFGAVARAAGVAAAHVAPLRGCGDPHQIDGLASRLLTARLRRWLPEPLLVTVCEGRKDAAPMMKEGQLLGPAGQDAVGVLLADPVECTTALADPAAVTRGSLVIVAAAPLRSVPPFYSGARAKSLFGPPGLGSDSDLLDMEPADLVLRVGQLFDCGPGDVTVHILGGPRRWWNRPFIEGFRRANARVNEIPAGDFEAHILAARKPAGRGIDLSYGLGGIPETLLAVPYVLMTGGTLLMRVDPLGEHTTEIRAARCADSLHRVFSAPQLMSDPDGDMFVAFAGITDTAIVRGVRTDPQTGAAHVQVIVASPSLNGEQCKEVTVLEKVSFV